MKKAHFLSLWLMRPSTRVLPTAEVNSSAIVGMLSTIA